MVYMITYDLNRTGQNYDGVIKAIKDCSTGKYVTEWKSAFLIQSHLPTSVVYDRIAPHLDRNDSIIIIEVKENYYGQLSSDAWEKIRLLF